MSRYEKETALVVDMGANATHIIAIVGGKPEWNSVRRINVGGTNAFELFAKMVALKNPQLKNKLSYSYLRDLYQKFGRIAIDYKEQLNFFKQMFEVRKHDEKIYRNRI